MLGTWVEAKWKNLKDQFRCKVDKSWSGGVSVEEKTLELEIL